MPICGTSGSIGELPEIVTLPKGKPVFSDKNLPSFSISYAGNMVGVALTIEGECGLDMELQRATRGFHSPHAPDNHTFSSNESLWISKQNDPNEARAQLITLRRSVLKLTGDVLNDDPRDLQLLPIAGRLKCAHVNHVEALCDAEDVLVWSVAVTPTIEKLSVWELDGKHGWKSLPDIHSRANNPTVRTQQGEIYLNGDADWSQIENWRARVTAKGSKVRITVPPMVRMDVSPDVVFEATPNLFTLDGRVDVPWARIVVHDLPESAVGVSSDVVMLNDNLQPEEPKTASIPINSNLIVHVGNNVRIDAFGLKARLTGDLNVVQDKQGLGLNGQINIPEGRFHAYGQDLIVRKGELLFSGPPDQPYLNIEAIRNPDATEDDVIAGVRVTGLADEPKAEIFSDPAMSQQAALSYLLRGQGLESDQSDSAAMTSMLIGLGVAQSGQIVGKIGETFGVSNLALDTQGVGDSSQVVVSGYVLPGLQVKYGVGIFDSIATLTLRYRLMPKLYLEAVSGVDQALDLLYQFEF